MTILLQPALPQADTRARCFHPAACILITALFAGALAGQTQPKSDRNIVFGGDSQFAPYEFLDAQGQPAGLNVDLIRAVARTQGFQVRIRLGPWQEIRNAVQSGDIDVATMFRSPNRAAQVDFAIPHELIYQEMFVRSVSPGLQSLSQLAGRRVLVETDTIAVDALKEMGFASQLRLVSSEPEALRGLLRDEGDVAIVTQASTRPFQERAEFAGRIKVTGPPVLLGEYSFVTQKGRRSLVESLNEGVAAVRASGEYEKLFDRWLRPDKSAGLVRRIAWIAAAILLVAVLVTVWNQTLRKKVVLQNQEIGALGTSYRELADYQAEIARINKELEAFAYSVSHDLRAPLRAINGFTRILLEDYSSQLDDEGKRVCATICDSAQSMGRLIDDLLRFSRFSRAALVAEPVDMRAMASQEFESLAATGVHLELQPLPMAVGDPALLRQVWVNLLSNAVKFSSKREHPVVRVTAEATQAESIYSVQDNGAGFDMKYAAKLFGVFQRLHGAKEFVGTGVGLAIVRRIVERHGGRVWAEGQVGQGATFHFALPKRQQP